MVRAIQMTGRSPYGMPCLYRTFTANAQVRRRLVHTWSGYPNLPRNDAGSDSQAADPRTDPQGRLDEDANPPLSDPEDDTEYGGTGTLPPKDTGAAVPPYEVRT